MNIHLRKSPSSYSLEDMVTHYNAIIDEWLCLRDPGERDLARLWLDMARLSVLYRGKTYTLDEDGYIYVK